MPNSNQTYIINSASKGYQMVSQESDAIPFNKPAVWGTEKKYLEQVFERGKFSGGGPFNQRCRAWLKHHYSAADVLPTTSCTHALEMAAMLCDLRPGDEVILPSYAFSSTATAFVRCGASLIFVDVEPSTMNIDPQAVAAAITAKTRVLVVLHYAGVACDMDALLSLAEKHKLIVVEDAAHAIFARYKDRLCGTLGLFGCLSFHETKNLHCGEGGALIINDSAYLDRAEIILEKGTDRLRLRRGEVDKYTWQDIGSSYVLSELNAAFLQAQLDHGREITAERLCAWQAYHECLYPLAERGWIAIPDRAAVGEHNGHIFWVKAKDLAERTALIAFLRARGIHSVFHYVPLHSARAGRRYGTFVGEDQYTTRESERLVRLPLYFGFSQTKRVVEGIKAFYSV